MCHACGTALAAISTARVRTHGLDLPDYRRRYGLNAKASLSAPALRARRSAGGIRRWQTNQAVRDGLAHGQALAASGRLRELAVAAQPAGSRRAQGRRAASRDGASAALRAHRTHTTVTARARWTAAAAALGFTDLKDYLTDRRARGATAHSIRTELGCGGSVAARLLRPGDGSTPR